MYSRKDPAETYAVIIRKEITTKCMTVNIKKITKK